MFNPTLSFMQEAKSSMLQKPVAVPHVVLMRVVVVV